MSDTITMNLKTIFVLIYEPDFIFSMLSTAERVIDMKLMHTKLPEFLKKMKAAANESEHPMDITIRGLENLTSAKMQSLRTGRIEHAVREMTMKDGVEKIEFEVIPRVPETMHTVIVKGVDKEGNIKHAILEVVNILHPTEEAYLIGCDDVDDRRPEIGRH